MMVFLEQTWPLWWLCGLVLVLRWFHLACVARKRRQGTLFDRNPVNPTLISPRWSCSVHRSIGDEQWLRLLHH
jgi:hypothetical protein